MTTVHQGRRCDATGPQHVEICEVAPRDGLQSESCQLSVDNKLALIRSLAACGARQIEIGSFVGPKAVPAMANTDAVAEQLKTQPLSGVRTLGLIMNDKGLERALAAGVDGVCIVTVLSDTLCHKNNNCAADEATRRAAYLTTAARAAGLYTRVDIATAWACPYEGKIPEARLLQHAERVYAAGPDEVALCDSIGHAHPLEVFERCRKIGALYGHERLVVHLHDTLGFGLANAAAALLAGVRRFDAAIFGLGGCPFARGARGNLATEDLVRLCNASGFATGYDLEALLALNSMLEPMIGRPLPSLNRYPNFSSLANTTTEGVPIHA